MKRLFDKSKLAFTLTGIGAYVVLFSLADKLSAAIGIKKTITAPLSIAFVLVMVIFLIRNRLTEEYGLCRFKGSYKGVLFFIPIVPILGLYLWNNAPWDGTALETALCVIAMLCVGFIEEMLFRGFLFSTMRADNLKAAVVVSSLTFGLGHIINFLNGAEFIATLLQVCYATALGFLLTMLFYKGKSLLPCIAMHSLFNVLSIFHVSGTRMQSVISSAVICVVSVAYALWILKKADDKRESVNE